jgi:hypothetical protein
MVSVSEGVVIGAVGGSFAGLSVWITQIARMKTSEWLDKRRVHKWLSQNTEDTGGKQTATTRDIASWTNLTEDRVRFICSYHNKIFLITSVDSEAWSIYSRLPKSVYENHGIEML